MKKGFGIFFLIIGTLNFIMGVIGLATEHAEQAGQKIMFGIGLGILGAYMVSTSKDKNNTLPKK